MKTPVILSRTKSATERGLAVERQGSPATFAPPKEVEPTPPATFEFTMSQSRVLIDRLLQLEADTHKLADDLCGVESNSGFAGAPDNADPSAIGRIGNLAHVVVVAHNVVDGINRNLARIFNRL